ncbi:MAG: NifB/NifX family molybdenum-iron cluster-binding protein [Pseudomonadota bacterium]
MKKILITLLQDEVAPRFDLATDVLVARTDDAGRVLSKKTLVLPAPSGEQMCQLVLSEGADVVVCGGIENEFWQYLKWKGVSVVDSVMGPWERALELSAAGSLSEGMILYPGRETD